MITMEKTVYIFHHTDLDGMGVRIVATAYAKSRNKPYKTYNCSYTTINPCVNWVLDNVPMEEIDEIIIGDISVDKPTAEKLQCFYLAGIPITLRDHHETANWLNDYDWAEVHEKIAGELRCGTWQLASCYPYVMSAYYTLIDKVDQWDTWKWKENNDLEAKNLNSLHKIMGDELFVDYIFKLENPGYGGNLFNDTAKLLIEVHERGVQIEANRCERNMVLKALKIKGHQFLVGFIYANKDFSEICDILLTEHPELDIMAVMGIPNNISWRTQKDLPIPLGEIAKMATGIGGGHPKASGSTLPKGFAEKLITDLFNDSELNLY